MKESLYQPYNPRMKHPGMFEKRFYYNSFNISLRPFFIPDDFILYNSWISTEINKGKLLVKETLFITEDYFDAIALSSGSQCVFGIVNTEPTFVAEVSPCNMYCPADLEQVIEPQPEDVLLQLLIAPHILMNQPVCEYILDTCLAWVASFPGRKRAFWIMDSHYYYSQVSARIGTLIHFAQGKEVYKYELPLYR